jgi:D-beta-D-heptose 7-phosphate kinase/D-beta-D-heptose 1-phosphate adenosyltransferase
MGVIISFPDLQRWFREKSRREPVLAPGCFDFMHIGHIRLLEAAARHGSPLVVALNSDYSVRKLKGVARPIVPWNDRAESLAALRFVDFVVGFDGDISDIVRTVRPTFLVKGADYLNREAEVKGKFETEMYGGKVLILSSQSTVSTTSLQKRLSLESPEKT